jgi:hypothetical protein
MPSGNGSVMHLSSDARVILVISNDRVWRHDGAQ